MDAQTEYDCRSEIIALISDTLCNINTIESITQVSPFTDAELDKLGEIYDTFVRMRDKVQDQLNDIWNGRE